MMMYISEELQKTTERKVSIIEPLRGTSIALMISGEGAARKAVRHNPNLGDPLSNGLLNHTAGNLRDAVLVHNGKLHLRKGPLHRQKLGCQRTRELILLASFRFAYITHCPTEHRLVAEAIQSRGRAKRDPRHLLDALATRLDHPMLLLLLLLLIL